MTACFWGDIWSLGLACCTFLSCLSSIKLTSATFEALLQLRYLWQGQGWKKEGSHSPGMGHTALAYYTSYRIYHVFNRIFQIAPYNTILGTLRILQPQGPQSPREALPGPPEKLSSPLEPPRGTPSPSERSMITCVLLPQPRRWCL